MTLVKTKIKRFLSTANRWRKSKGLTLALVVLVLGILQPHIEQLNNPNITLLTALAIGVIRFLTTKSLSEK